MDAQDRRRSTSVGRQPQQMMGQGIPRSSPQYISDPSRLSIEPMMQPAHFAPGSFASGVPVNGANGQFSFQGEYMGATMPGPSYAQQQMPANDFAAQQFAQQVQRQRSISHGQQMAQQAQQQFQQEYMNGNMSSSHFSDPFRQSDPNLLDPASMVMSGQPPNGSINPADIMGGNGMSSPPNTMGSQQNLMAFDNRSPPGGRSPSPQQQNQFHSPAHSRNVSLDPSSANIIHAHQNSTDWSGMMSGPSFQSHRRAPSEHSDVSSVAPSPYLAQQDSFDTFGDDRSPMLSAQRDSTLYNDALGIETFTISDHQIQQAQQVQQQQQQQIQQQQAQKQAQEHARRGVSPGHSPYISPQHSPNPGHGNGSQMVVPSNDLGNQFGDPGPQLFNGVVDQGVPSFNLQETSDMGQADSMAPPSINVELAPPASAREFQLSIDPSENDPDNTLSPPERGRKNRIRAKSDPQFHPASRSISPAGSGSLVQPQRARQRSLSPFDNPFPTGSMSREASPSAVSATSGKGGSRRSSTSSVTDRNYIMSLANPDRATQSGADRQGRIQKHPATFQCTLCPKRFTRAYNLRSHLRTHTDERPFVCTVCGKAFARQHDRKRHEGLHSGEKKFVCKGELTDGNHWGCGRRFARADALGRHFRSEAGRVCIKPLLDEEARERQRQFEEHMLAQQQAGLMVSGQGMTMPPPQNPMLDLNNGGFTLPAALLAQYPALQGLQWDQLGGGPAGGNGDDLDDGGVLSGRSSFDGSGGDFGDVDDEDGGSGYVSGPGSGFGAGGGGGNWGMGGGGAGHEWMSDYEGR
ncbi:hypothetical protein MMC25_002098 [Agyrium rufum]|nr:hypothetical protein [Agyrium rufum]